MPFLELLRFDSTLFLIYSSLSVFYTKQCTDTINRNYQKSKSLGVGVGFGNGRKMFRVAPDANKLAKYGWIMVFKRSFNRILQRDYPYRKIRNLGLRSNYQPNLKCKIGFRFLGKVLRNLPMIRKMTWSKKIKILFYLFNENSLFSL